MGDCESSAWTWLLHHGPTSVAEVRRLNQNSAIQWTVNLLLALCDADVSTASDCRAMLRAELSQNSDMVFDVIRCYDDGKCVAEVAECDDGEFVVVKKAMQKSESQQ